MLDKSNTPNFAPLNRAFNAVFRPGRLSIGLVVPLEANRNDPVPTMTRHLERAALADELGFAALWLRDVPFNVPSFGDAGQVFDPFVYLGALGVATRDIALGVASIVLPLRHPAHVAKAAASADQLSGGRLLLGVASGDRPEEYPALNKDFSDRGARFRDSLAYIRAMAQDYPRLDNPQGDLSGGIDMLPKPAAGRLPLLITGGSQQTPEWVARHGDGWMTYPRGAAAQSRVVADYRARVAQAGLPDKPVMQSLYVDLVDQADAPPRPIHLGFSAGTDYLRRYLHEIRDLGINHVALNLRFNVAGIEPTLHRLADEVLPEFHD
ncbi:TIGR03571 family LLM class oxidoreductase [Ruegeria atlantica]|uniref:TIGR03571 family LLM class oxidoreductase n=1 Tax=Ruegeria atlantica TaxID=81569 RepID=A0AA90YYG1_9RHOB|nr:LLM class oxidoreductase [Ruegeria atlantica]NOE17346.1 TIGR03571 family LLM class oxidoreductase [Ruegeria atlantica]